MRIRFDKIDGFIKIYDGNIYLVRYDYEKCNAIYYRIIYLISEKTGITDSINHKFERTDSYNSVPIERILTFHNVISQFCYNSLCQLSIRIKMSTTMIYF